MPRDGRGQELEALRLRCQHLVESRHLGSQRGEPLRDRRAFRALERLRAVDLALEALAAPRELLADGLLRRTAGAAQPLARDDVENVAGGDSLTFDDVLLDERSGLRARNLDHAALRRHAPAQRAVRGVAAEIEKRRQRAGEPGANAAHGRERDRAFEHDRTVSVACLRGDRLGPKQR